VRLRCRLCSVFPVVPVGQCDAATGCQLGSLIVAMTLVSSLRLWRESSHNHRPAHWPWTL